MRIRRAKHLVLCGAVLLCASFASAQQSSLVQTRAFAPGQSVLVDINVGDVRVLPNQEDRQVRLVIEPRRGISQSEMQSWIREFDVKGNQATVRLHMPRQGHDSGTVELYVPSATALNVDLGVGDVRIDGIQGDKDVGIRVGDLSIAGLNRADYGIVKFSCGIGDVKDDVFSTSQSGFLGKSAKFVGSGKYHLRAHVGIGDIRLRAAAGGID